MNPRSFLPSVFLAVSPILAADPFTEHVRPTEPLTPEQERAALHAPEGFEIQLFASEPDIAKPLNMAFDERGRLWLTNTLEYPYVAAVDKPGRDSIKILEDIDGDGRADKVSTFADGLNIPIALLPYRGGAVGWSIPNIWHFQDVDGDGRADQRSVLYGPLGYERDTHGNISTFRRGLDGWLYGTHGFNNTSTFVGKDGSRFTVQSGNTYRVKLDGSRVEQHTFGQVNPFGGDWDIFGNLYTVDCHSLPIYQLLPGAYYPSFGKPHDGIGFGPTMIAHDHSSTGLCGLVFNESDHWPAEFRDNMFLGNVLTCRVNRDQIKFHGSTPEAIEQADFIRSDDPWFRPVDLRMGPDGAMYIADFYNKIIGHYEVPLNHPGRDRHRGRIWRVVYKGGRNAPLSLKDCDFTKLTIERLLAELASPNATRRYLATDRLEDHFGQQAVEPVKALLANPAAKASQVVHGLWLLHRLSALSEDRLSAFARHRDHVVRTHAMLIWRENPALASADLINESILDSSPDVQRAALTALGSHPKLAEIGPMVRLLPSVPAEDTHLRHALRMTLRNALREPGAFASVTPELVNAYPNELAEIAAAVPTAEAATFNLGLVAESRVPRTSKLKAYLEHIARHLPEEKLPSLAATTRGKLANRPDLQTDLYLGLVGGLAQRGASVPPEIKAWGAELAKELLAGDPDQMAWSFQPSPADPESQNPWFPQSRPKLDGAESMFFSSLPPGGESLVGVLRSKPFPLAGELEFWIAGHDGVPNKPAQGKNLVRLVDDKTGEVLRETPAPRSDQAQRVDWDLSQWQGRQGRIEAIDADTGAAYAWLAIGVFSLPELAVPETPPWQRLASVIRIVQTTPLPDLATEVARLLRGKELPHGLQADAAECLARLREAQKDQAVFVALLRLPIALDVRQAIVDLLSGGDPAKTNDVAALCMKSLPFRQQRTFAVELAGSANGADRLLSLCEARQAPARLLQERMVKEKLAALKNAALDERAAKLVKDLPPADAALAVMVEKRKTSFAQAKPDAARGAQVFGTYCAVCHQLDGQGNLVGPQLAGIGNRGLDRLLEDIIDPNRQVDPAFQSVLLTMKDGGIRQGLPRREEGDRLVFVDIAGQEFTVPRGDVADRKASALSLMPPTFGEGIPEAEFHDLLAYLLSKRGP